MILYPMTARITDHLLLCFNHGQILGLERNAQLIGLLLCNLLRLTPSGDESALE